MIDDKNIIAESAKYWCILSDQKIKSALDSSMDKAKKAMPQIEKKIEDDQNGNVQESSTCMDPLLECMVAEYLGINVGKKKYALNEAGVPRAPRVPKAPKAPKAPRAPRVPKAPKAPRAPKAPKATKPVGGGFKGGAKTAWNGTKFIGRTLWNAGAGAFTGLVTVATGAYVAVMKGYEMLKNWADENIPGGSSSVKTIAAIIAASWVLYKSKDYLVPRMKEAFNYMKSGKCLAKCEFNSSGEDYVARFNYNTMKWELAYKDLKLLSKNSIPSHSDASSFFKTKFFDDFTQRCYEIMSRYLNDESFNGILGGLCADKSIDKDTLSLYKMLIVKRKTILDNLKRGSYQYID